MSRMIEVAISDLYVSRSNVRERYDAATDKKLPELVASILSLGGLIQPLAVAKRKKGGGYEVIAGQRRTAALKQIAATHPDFQTVEAVEITDPKLFSEASLAENYARASMTLPEVYTAFARIRSERPNATLEELGAMFGFDAGRAGRVMRLAGLSNKVMQAYRAGEIDDAEAQAFAATEVHSLQDEVLVQLEGQPKYQRGPQAIRRLLGLIAGDEKKRLAFVGLDTYREAGGEFEDDLFNPGEGRLRNPDLLEQLFATKFDEAKDVFVHRLQRGTRRIVPDGAWGMADLKFSWASQAPQKTEYGMTSSDYELKYTPKTGKLSDEDEATVKRLEGHVERLNGELETEGFGDDDPRIAQLDTFEEDLARFESQRPVSLPRKGAIVGIVSLNHHGDFDVDLWYASRTDKGIDEPKNGKARGAVGAEQSEGEKMRRRVGITKDGAHALFLLRRDMIRDQLCLAASHGSSIALDFLIYSQARTILVPAGLSWDKTPYIKGDPLGIETPASQDTGGTKPPKKVRDVFATLTAASAYKALLAELAERDWATAEDPIRGWALFRSSADHDAAQAIVACHGLMASTTFYQDGETPRMIEELAKYLTPEEGAVDWRKTVVLDAAFFALINHRRRQELLIEWGGDAAEVTRAKAGATAAMCAEAVPDGWLPAPLMLQDVEPLAVAKQEAINEAAAAEAGDGFDAGDEELAGN